MCAPFMFMFQGQFIHLVIGPGAARAADPDAPLILDVRNYFARDEDPNPNAFGPQMALLRRAANDLWARLSAIRGTNAVLRLQCQEGRARSPRCLGAFLITFYGFSVEEVLRYIRAGFARQNGDCDQELQEDRIRRWLEAYYMSPHRR